MKTIRKLAKNVIQENVDYINDLFERFGRSEEFCKKDTPRSYVEWQVLFKWLFNDKTITQYGENK